MTAYNQHRGEGGVIEYDYYMKPTYGKKKLKYEIPQFYDGGFTGYGLDTDIAGIVHANEYVINAKTTRDLGLNGAQGIFHQMLTELGNIKAAIAVIAQHTGLSASRLASLVGAEQAKAALGGYDDVLEDVA